jgi:hypothetical protein
MTRTAWHLAALALSAAACTPVLPYERGRLVQRTMLDKPPLDAAFDAHVSDLRESAIGASSGASASCGCR